MANWLAGARDKKKLDKVIKSSSADVTVIPFGIWHLVVILTRSDVRHYRGGQRV